MHPDALPDPHVDSGELDTMISCSSDSDGSSDAKPCGQSKMALIHGVGFPDKVRFQWPGEEVVVKEDCLLNGLYPWYYGRLGYDPEPVDADLLLPAIITGYGRPCHLLPNGVQPILRNDEMTTLRRLGKSPLACHFTLGKFKVIFSFVYSSGQHLSFSSL